MAVKRDQFPDYNRLLFIPYLSLVNINTYDAVERANAQLSSLSFYGSMLSSSNSFFSRLSSLFSLFWAHIEQDSDGAKKRSL